MDNLIEICNKYKYLTIDEDGKSEVYTSLRQISQNINVDYPTISKRLKENDGQCACTSKTTKKNYYIKRIHS